MQIKTLIYAKRDINSNVIFWALNIDKEEYTLTIETGTVKPTELTNRKFHTVVITKRDINIEIKSLTRKKELSGYKLLPIKNDIELLMKYYTDIEEFLPEYNTGIDETLKPMKCQVFDEDNPNIPKTAYLEPKLNGIRATLRLEQVIVDKGTLFETKYYKWVFRSKEGLIYHLPHITDKLNDEFSSLLRNDLTYDGELYIHGKKLNQIRSSVPTINENGTLSTPGGNPLDIQFVIFDVSIDNTIMSIRKSYLEQIIHNNYNDCVYKDVIVYHNHINIGIIHSEYVYNITVDDVRKARDTYIELGYEGVIVRDTEGLYHFGQRPSCIQKYKKSIDSEFLIHNIIKKDKGDGCIFICKNDINEELFKCVPIGTFKEQFEYLQNKHKYIGKMATIKYYERSGVKDAPFHANVIAIRDYE